MNIGRTVRVFRAEPVVGVLPVTDGPADEREQDRVDDPVPTPVEVVDARPGT